MSKNKLYHDIREKMYPVQEYPYLSSEQILKILDEKEAIETAEANAVREKKREEINKPDNFGKRAYDVSRSLVLSSLMDSIAPTTMRKISDGDWMYWTYYDNGKLKTNKDKKLGFKIGQAVGTGLVLAYIGNDIAHLINGTQNSLTFYDIIPIATNLISGIYESGRYLKSKFCEKKALKDSSEHQDSNIATVVDDVRI